MIKVAIIDDEKQVRSALKADIANECPELELVGEAGSVKEGLELLANIEIDILFLDVKMNDGTGFDLLEKLGRVKFNVVFTTAYSEYALKAFEFSAMDYLLKPVDASELRRVVGKVRSLENGDLYTKVQSILANIKASSIEKIALPTSDGISIYDVNQIVRCEASGNYVLFYFEKDKKLLVSRTLREYEDMMGGLNFFRVHKSHLVNMDHIKNYVNRDNGYLVMSDQSTIPVSQRKKSELLKALGQRFGKIS